MSFRSALFIASAAAFTMAGSSAIAAPQVLGLVASNGVPTPLACEGGTCSAHFSTFCLQQNRPAPSRGDAFTVAPGASVTLVLTTAEGQTLRVPAADRLRIQSEISFTSVSIAMPQADLAELGANTVAVEIGPSVSLIPVALAGDPSPQGDDEIALATGPMRLAAARDFEAPGRTSDAARITSILINALPLGRPETPAARNALWLAALQSPATAAATPDGVTTAARIYEACMISVESRSSYSMRNCLELRHADLLAETNHKFWKNSAGY